MIYRQPFPEEAIDQGDIIDGCPLLEVTGFDPVNVDPLEVGYSGDRVVVLTQTCDLANKKTTAVVVAPILPAQNLVDEQTLKASDVRGPIRSGRVYGLYYLPKSADLGLPEAIVDLDSCTRFAWTCSRPCAAKDFAGRESSRSTGNTWQSTLPTRIAGSACRSRMRRNLDGRIQPIQPQSSTSTSGVD